MDTISQVEVEAHPEEIPDVAEIPSFALVKQLLDPEEDLVDPNLVEIVYLQVLAEYRRPRLSISVEDAVAAGAMIILIEKLAAMEDSILKHISRVIPLKVLPQHDKDDWEVKVKAAMRGYLGVAPFQLKRKFVEQAKYWRGFFGKSFPVQCAAKSKEKVFGKVKSDSSDVILQADNVGISFLDATTREPLLLLNYFDIEKIEPFGAKDSVDIQLDGIVYSFKSSRATDIKMFLTGLTAKLLKAAKMVVSTVDSASDTFPMAKGDLIEVIERISSDSWRGRLKGRVGTFTPNQVEPVCLKPLRVRTFYFFLPSFLFDTHTIRDLSVSRRGEEKEEGQPGGGYEKAGAGGERETAGAGGEGQDQPAVLNDEFRQDVLC